VRRKWFEWTAKRLHHELYPNSTVESRFPQGWFHWLTAKPHKSLTHRSLTWVAVLRMTFVGRMEIFSGKPRAALQSRSALTRRQVGAYRQKKTMR